MFGDNNKKAYTPFTPICTQIHRKNTRIYRDIKISQEMIIRPVMRYEEF